MEAETTLPIPVKLRSTYLATIPCPCQPVGVPEVGVGCENDTAPFAPDPCVIVAPPPTSLLVALTVEQLAVEVGVNVYTAGFPPVLAVVPATTVVPPIVLTCVAAPAELGQIFGA